MVTSSNALTLSLDRSSNQWQTEDDRPACYPASQAVGSVNIAIGVHHPKYDLAK